MKNKSLHFLFSLLAVMCLFAGTAFAQGVTTASMRGVVVDDSGSTLPGATVVAVHVPSGTTYGTVTREDGRYSFANLRVGGPYTLKVSFVGYTENVEENLYLNLGEQRRKNVTLNEGAIQLEGVEITAKAGVGDGAGAATQISSEDLETLPSLNRNINDFARLTPQASQFNGGLSIAGINNRYNAIYIDGAVNNDVFGLAASGTNGGQTGISPISIDAIDQIQVVISPYDVSYGGFAGGGINAVTKSGTNEYQGSVYYYLQNEGLAGKTNGVVAERFGSDREKLAEFDNKTYGLTVGGPIVKDKAFFFINAEIQDDVTPVPDAFADYEGDSNLEDLNALSSFLQSEYGYDPGGFLTKNDMLEGTKVLGKFDFNLNEQHSLSLRHQYTKGEQTNVNRTDEDFVSFQNSGVFFPTTTNSTALEFNSTFGADYSNNLILGFTTVRDDRDPIGSNFPNVEIEDGAGDITFGSEQFSTANELNQDIFTITDNFKMYRGDHTWTFGTHNEIGKFYNLFIRQNFGAYEFESLQDFYDGNVDNYDHSYSLVDDLTGDGSAAAAEFNTVQFGIYAQDEITLSNKTTLTAGLRLDMPMITTDPDIDPTFNTVTLPAIAAAGYDLEGTQGGESPDGQIMFSPRVGVNIDLNEDQSTVIRGGVGVFTSRIPYVWPGAALVNNGLTIGGVDEGDIEDLEFIADPNNQYINENFTVPSGQVDLFAKDFKYPQLFRGSAAVDHQLGDGWNVTVEGIYSKTLNNVRYQNVNSDPTVDFAWTNANGQDTRPVYTNSAIDGTYSAIYLATNTDEGYAYNLTAQVDKVFPFGLNTMLAYTYGDSEALFEGTSSQNSSQWRGSMSIDGRNNAVVGRSDFSAGHRIISALTYGFDWNEGKNAKTTFGLFVNGQSGSPYSYVYGSRSAQNINNEDGSTSRNRSLIWIPADMSEINLIDDGDMTAAEQWALLDAFIEDDDYLSENRGGYAEKNGARVPFSGVFDFRVAQDLGIQAGGQTHAVQISADIFNFANLINQDWGVRLSSPRDAAYELMDFEGYAADGTTPQFTFTDEDLGDERFGVSDLASRWRMRLGLKYLFNQ